MYDGSVLNSKVVIGHNFHVNSISGNYAKGDYVVDTFHFTGQYLDFVQLGLASESTTKGLRILDDTTQIFEKEKDPYPIILDIMMHKGTINLKAFSLWLDNQEIGHLCMAVSILLGLG